MNDLKKIALCVDCYTDGRREVWLYCNKEEVISGSIHTVTFQHGDNPEARITFDFNESSQRPPEESFFYHYLPWLDRLHRYEAMAS